jgi:hypothetical protein
VATAVAAAEVTAVVTAMATAVATAVGAAAAARAVARVVVTTVEVEVGTLEVGTEAKRELTAATLDTCCRVLVAAHRRTAHRRSRSQLPVTNPG